MKRNAVVLIVCHLVLGWASQWYAADAQAMPAKQSELLVGTPPLPVFSTVTQLREQVAPPMFSAATANSDTALPDDRTSCDPAGPAAYIGNSGTATANNFCQIKFEDEYLPEVGSDDGAAHKSLSVQFGQHMGDNISNILGEFDGFRVDYRLSSNLMLNGVIGYPVMSDQDKFNDARQVFGLSANTGKIGHAWDLSSYLIQQHDNGKARRNVGGAVRYLREKRSLLLLFDYDMASNSLDAFTASGALRLQHSTTLSATVDVRSSSLYKRQQKFLQRTMATTDGWTWNLPMDRITHFTQDLSEEVTTLTVGLTHTFSSRLKMVSSAALLAVSHSNGADESAAAPSEYFYHLKLSGSDLIFSGNSNVLDLSHRITESMRTSSATIDTRYTINSCWKVNPRLHTDYRDNLLDSSVKWVTSPSVRMEYSWRDQYGVNIEAGGEWVTRELSNQASSDSSYFVSLGYRASY